MIKFRTSTFFLFFYFIISSSIYFSVILPLLDYLFVNDWGQSWFWHAVNMDYRKLYLINLNALIDHYINNMSISEIDFKYNQGMGCEHLLTVVRTCNNSLQIPLTSNLSYLYLPFFYIIGQDSNIIHILAFILNIIFVILTYNVLEKLINDVLKLNYNPSFIFFLNPQLIFYSQTMGKEIFLMFIFISIIYFTYKKNYLILILLIISLFFVRYQMLIAVGFFFILIIFKEKKLFLLVTYLLISFFAAYLGQRSNNNWTYDINESFVLFLAYINTNYYFLGNIIFNPFILLQYFYDSFRMIIFHYNNQINIYYLVNIPILFYMILKSKSIISILFKLKIIVNSKVMIIIFILIPFILTVLGSPSVSSRYLFPIVYPVIVIILFYEKKLRYDSRN